MKLESRDKVSKSENEKLHTSLVMEEAKGNLKVDKIRGCDEYGYGNRLYN